MSPRRVVIVAEDSAGHLAARVVIDELRGDRELAIDERPRKISQREGFPRSHGHIGGRPAGPGAHLYRRWLLHLTRELGEDGLVVFMRDADCERERPGFTQARDENTVLQAVLGMPAPEVEAWFLLGFAPRDRHEEKLLADVRAELGVDPIRTPSRLTSGRRAAPKDAKRIEESLTAKDADRRTDCMRHAITRRHEDEACGLVAFVEDLQAAIEG